MPHLSRSAALRLHTEPSIPIRKPLVRWNAVILRECSRTTAGSQRSSCRQQCRDVSTPAALATLPHAVSACLTQACQDATDKAVAVAVLLPLCVGLYTLAYLLRPLPDALQEEGRVFEDPGTGMVFGSHDGQLPERDQNGELAFRPLSYTSYPVEAGYEGDRLRVDVGPVKDRQPRTYVFSRLLQQPSQLVMVTLPRPLGIVFEFDERRKRVVVVDFVDGSNAGRMAKVAKLNRQMLERTAQVGDVLRAVTCTNFVYPTKALFGAVPPQRHIVVYGADGQGWNSVSSALRKGDFKDGEVTLVLERRLNSSTSTSTSTRGGSTSKQNNSM